MGSYVPNTRREQEEMLRAIGLAQMSDLYADVPESVFLQKPLNATGGHGRNAASCADGGDGKP